MNCPYISCAKEEQNELVEKFEQLKTDLEWALDARQKLRFTRDYNEDDQRSDEIRKRHFSNKG